MKKLKVHRILPVLTLVVGLVLMAGKIYADSEPGAVPLLLVLIGIAWLFITRQAGATSSN